jgi:putative YhdH/YhfP family quinone oxidoreductase
METFKAFVARRSDDGMTGGVETLGESDLDQGEVTVRVEYSSVNYKDLLVIDGAPGLTKEYPQIPGIDAAGTVVESSGGGFEPEDRVVVSGGDFGVNHSGGYSEYARVPAAWVTRLPDQLSTHQAMAYGTAGFTAALSLQELLDHGVTAEGGPVVVTGASGGVGSFAVSFASAEGLDVVAATNKPDDTERLTGLGAREVIATDQLRDTSGKHLMKGAWAGAIDSLGGDVLSTIIRQTTYGGTVTNCGMLAGNRMEVSVFPFLLRAVRLIGVDSVQCPRERRERAWKAIAERWHSERALQGIPEVSLDELSEAVEQKKAGHVRGRYIVRVGS